MTGERVTDEMVEKAVHAVEVKFGTGQRSYFTSVVAAALDAVLPPLIERVEAAEAEKERLMVSGREQMQRMVLHTVVAAERLPAVVRRVAAARIWKERKFVASAADRRAGIPRDVDEWLAGLIADDLRAALTEAPANKEN